MSKLKKMIALFRRVFPKALSGREAMEKLMRETRDPHQQVYKEAFYYHPVYDCSGKRFLGKPTFKIRLIQFTQHGHPTMTFTAGMNLGEADKVCKELQAVSEEIREKLYSEGVYFSPILPV